MYVRMHNELATKLGSQINTIVCLTAEFAMRVRDTLPHPRKIFARLGYA